MPERIWVRSFVHAGACHLVRSAEDSRTRCGRSMPIHERNQLREAPLPEFECVKCKQNEAASEKRRETREARHAG